MVPAIILLLEITVLSVIKSMGIIEVNDFFASALIILFSIVFLISIERNGKTKEYANQITCGYIVRIILLYFDLFGQNIHVLPQSGVDSAMFYRTSTELVLYGNTDKNSNFSRIMGRLFGLIGINHLFGQFLLMLLSIVSILVFIHIIDRIDIGDVQRARSAWLICLLPNFALLSSLFLRESVVTLLITSCVCCICEWISNSNQVLFVLALVFSVAACFFHSGSIGITIGCIVCLLIFDNSKKKIHTSLSNIIMGVVFAVGLSYIFLQYGELLMGKFIGVNSISDIANTNQYGGSSYARYVGNSSNPINLLIYTGPRIVYFLFSPFPWQWRGISDIIAFLFSGLYYLVTIKNAFLYLYAGYKKNRELLICLIIVASICTFVFAWGVSNTGTATRHRDKMVCLYGVIYALAFQHKKQDAEFNKVAI